MFGFFLRERGETNIIHDRKTAYVSYVTYSFFILCVFIILLILSWLLVVESCFETPDVSTWSSLASPVVAPTSPHYDPVLLSWEAAEASDSRRSSHMP